ncbi:UDP-N-acetylmuramoyl-tripeptide--D-alanyl-D-alanine ligase [Acidiphilium sp. AL]|uniref:UDP-N-acetylmuramoyl-tripeptide--D-alanyl-D-alanine ligase n=1 Tax=Acidiphilium iwatense TaxID=768198 RepID=A0ABS9DS54_9PROT|nr:MULTISPECIES: UDP-N-acetylmuramoyl-tripeptide--D-alanyl-D-alanine ligase [Acidiphilium]MCF3945542.1 UDP-N-acetylmuramoyl-tripeptide--D-alanyl-D-alanine ligase [Acidiphilium iwatense]MCU4159653.1 UDP-N-acetylmuramoyl-tripeptide--D-alanyl-D-alanine ligase [Acidiphilium sp. AL]
MSALWTEADLAIATGGDFLRGGFAADGIAIDSRALTQGDLFVALEAARDGHDFVADAEQRGAAGALVSRDVGTGPALVVEDTLVALGRMGEFARARSSARVAAVTGSVGKSTTKEMLRRILGAFGPVHAAEASFNNHIGVPLTLARLPRDAAFAVVEIGMNHPGEIAPLAEMARPHVGVITTVEAAHIGLMGSIEAIADEKAELLRGLVPGGAAVLPRGPHLPRLARRAPDGTTIISFGTQALAEARLIEAESDADGVDVTANILRRVVRFRLAAPGRHMAMNAVAALAAAAALGLDAEPAAAALDGFAPLAGRGARRSVAVGGATITMLDESYNASGASVRAALGVLALQTGRRVVVLGDMLELGDFAEAEHRDLAQPVGETADLVFACGPHMRTMFDDLPARIQGAWAPDSGALAPLVRAALRDGDAVLIKGSLGSRMRAIVAALEGHT